MTLFDTLIGFAYLLIALGLFHRGMPAATAIGPLRMWKVWCLALALGSFGIGRLGTAAGFHMAQVYSIGHLGLLAFAGLLLRVSWKSGLRWPDVS